MLSVCGYVLSDMDWHCVITTLHEARGLKVQEQVALFHSPRPGGDSKSDLKLADGKACSSDEIVQVKGVHDDEPDDDLNDKTAEELRQMVRSLRSERGQLRADFIRMQRHVRVLRHRSGSAAHESILALEEAEAKYVVKQGYRFSKDGGFRTALLWSAMNTSAQAMSFSTMADFCDRTVCLWEIRLRACRVASFRAACLAILQGLLHLRQAVAAETQDPFAGWTLSGIAVRGDASNSAVLNKLDKVPRQQLH